MHKIFLKQTNKKKTFKKLLRAKTDIVECSLRAYELEACCEICLLIHATNFASHYSLEDSNKAFQRKEQNIFRNHAKFFISAFSIFTRLETVLIYKPKHMLFLKYVLILSYFSLYQSLASNIQKLSVEPNSYLICSCCTKVNIVRETTVNIL